MVHTQVFSSPLTKNHWTKDTKLWSHKSIKSLLNICFVFEVSLENNKKHTKNAAATYFVPMLKNGLQRNDKSKSNSSSINLTMFRIIFWYYIVTDETCDQIHISWKNHIYGKYNETKMNYHIPRSKISYHIHTSKQE